MAFILRYEKYVDIFTESVKMKIAYIFGIVFLFDCLFGEQGLMAQCPPGGLSFSTQADVDAFLMDYPNCTALNGGIFANGSNISNVKGLRNLVSIDGNIAFFNTSCDSIILPDLASINGGVQLHQNAQLESVDLSKLESGLTAEFYSHLNTSLNYLDLRKVNSIGDYFYLHNNVSLEYLNLTSLISIGGYFYIFNSGLTDLNTLAALTTINGNCDIASNFNLSDCSALCTVLEGNGINGMINISNNPSECSSVDEIAMNCDIVIPDCPDGDVIFTEQIQIDDFVMMYPHCTRITGSLIANGFDISDVSALVNLENIEGDLSFINTLCTTVDFPNLDSINGHIYFHQNVSLDSVNLSSVFYGDISSVYSHNNTLLRSFDLSAIDSLGDSLYIHNNSSLKKLNLNELKFIDGNLYIHNSGLCDLNQLINLDSINGNMTISDNSVLTDCSGLCPIITDEKILGIVVLQGNPAPCDSESNLATYCAMPICDGVDLIISQIVQDEYFASHKIYTDALVAPPQNVSFTAVDHVEFDNFQSNLGSQISVYIDSCR